MFVMLGDYEPIEKSAQKGWAQRYDYRIVGEYAANPVRQHGPNPYRYNNDLMAVVMRVFHLAEQNYGWDWTDPRQRIYIATAVVSAISAWPKEYTKWIRSGAVEGQMPLIDDGRQT